MVKEFQLPDMGEGIETGDVVNVLIAEGDTIQDDQTILEVETDKAVLEVPCPFGGKVVSVHVSKGDKVKVGATLVSVETEASVVETGAASDTDTVAVAEPSEPREPAVAPSPAEQVEPVAPEPSPTVLKEQPSSREPVATEPIPAGPATRRLARELGVDLNEMAAAHPGQRLTEEHVKEFVRVALAGGGVGRGVQVDVSLPALPDFAQWGSVERVPMSSLQRKTAANLSVGWRVMPHVTQFDVADVSELEGLRRRYHSSGHPPIKLTVTAFVVKAVATALKAFPQFNASLDSATDELVFKKYFHIGIAVDTDVGLIVPVLRDVDQKRVLAIAAEMADLAERTRQRKIGLDELRGGTFTVTNLGGIGGTAFTPVINYPEVAILGLARSREEPVVKEGAIGTGLMLPLCLSYDHRVINGADGARFLRKIVGLLEDPELLLLEG